MLPPFGRHHAGFSLKALDRMGIERIGSLGDAVRPAGNISDSRSPSNTRCMTGHAGALINTGAIDGCSGSHLNGFSLISARAGHTDLTYGLKRIFR